MTKHKKKSIFLSLVIAITMLLTTISPAFSQGMTPPGSEPTEPPPPGYSGHPTNADRRAAAERAASARQAAGIPTYSISAVMDPGGIPDYFGTIPNWANSPIPTITTGVWTPGTGIRKFVDSLPGLDPLAPNGLGQYIPIAQNDPAAYPGSDYYEIGLVQYTQQMSRDLPATTLRGYVQISTAAVIGKHIALHYPGGAPILDIHGAQVYAVDNPQYLGPLIISGSYDPTKPAGVAGNGKPTRIKFTNYLPTGTGGDLFIPTDTTVMGAGMGPTGEVTGVKITNGGSGYSSAPTVTFNGGGFSTRATAVAIVHAGKVNVIHITNPGAGYTSAPTISFSGGGGSAAAATASFIGAMSENYTENRATIHLHGGNTPWISDGTPHQWTTPALQTTSYPEGVSVYNVPDMADPGPGSLTFYYSNEQSARLMFYHDHAYGITRLNVYVGEAAGYLLTDPAEQTLVNGGTIPGTAVSVPAGTVPSAQIPLVIQDRTFVDASTIASQDPTWNSGTTPPIPHTGDLWFPHVYMPNQNPIDLSGANAMGRWDYGPWFWPPFTGIQNGPVANPLFGTDPLEGPLNPGTPNPSLTPESFMDTPIVNGTVYPYLEVQPQAYRFRILNACNDRMLNLQFYTADPTVITADGRTNTEVKMVPAVATAGFPDTWPTDGREGGVPDPTTAGPDFIQIGTEGGLLPAPVVIPSQPVGYLYDRRNIVVLNITDTALFLGPAERADVIVDFSQFAGKTLILYNDAPAPVPAFDTRIDYYTGDPDQISTGGAPSTEAGFGPNTRTIMQIRVASVSPSGSGLSSVSITHQGGGYSAPVANFTGGGGSGAIANVTGSVDSISMLTLGTDFTAAPTVTIGDIGTGSGATGKATISVTSIALDAGGSGYITPVVTITDPTGTGTGATASATLTGDVVTGVSILTPGSGYTAPVVTITDSGGPGAGAAAHVTGAVDSLVKLTSGSGYSAPTISLTGGGGTGADAKVTIKVTTVTLTNPGSGYTGIPIITITDTFPGAGSGATALAHIPNGTAFNATPLDTGLPVVFKVSQPEPIVKNAVYDGVYGSGYGPADSYVRIQDTFLSFFNGSPLSSIKVLGEGSGYAIAPLVSITGGGGTGAVASAMISGGKVVAIVLINPGNGYTSEPTVTLTGGGASANAAAKAVGGLLIPLQPKAIQELFTLDYGRMNATLGVEIPNTTGINQTTIPLGYIDPGTELMYSGNAAAQLGSLEDGTQIWKVTHNGVDTHAIHFHMFNVQLINRVGWDGAIRPPKANEIGWKETVIMNPLEDAIVAIRPIVAVVPWPMYDSIRPYDVTQPLGASYAGVDPLNLPVTIVNSLVNFGREYVWHCHLLGHEENDMMRPVMVAESPLPTGNLSASMVSTPTPHVHLTWNHGSSIYESGALVERALDAGFTQDLQKFQAPHNTPLTLGQVYDDYSIDTTKGYYYRVYATDLIGGVTPGYPWLNANSIPSNVIHINAAVPTFADVPFGYSQTLGGVTTVLYPYIQALYNAGLTAGCLTNPLRYCPVGSLNRAQMAVFSLRANFGLLYNIPPAPWPTFIADNWTLNGWAQPWAEGMWQQRLTAGCTISPSPLMYCPDNILPREQAAVLGLHMKYGANYTPPPATGTVFADMTNPAYWAAPWAEKAYADGLILRCSTSGGQPNFCPSTLMNRAWTAYMIVKAKNLPLP